MMENLITKFRQLDSIELYLRIISFISVLYIIFFTILKLNAINYQPIMAFIYSGFCFIYLSIIRSKKSKKVMRIIETEYHSVYTQLSEKFLNYDIGLSLDKFHRIIRRRSKTGNNEVDKMVEELSDEGVQLFFVSLIVFIIAVGTMLI